MSGGLTPMAQLDAVALGCIVGLMLAETRRSRANEAALESRGALKPDGDVWTWMAALYPLSFFAMGVEGLWRAQVGSFEGRQRWFVAGLVLFVAAKALKYWAIRTLGDRWSFRVMILPGQPLVRGGPYRYLAHPNYVGVVGELVGTAMMMTAAFTGPLMCAAFGVVLWGRVRFENRVLSALAPRSEAGV
jgi:methyltransferase